MLSGEKDPRFEDSRTAINHQIHKLVRTLIFGNIHIGNGNFLLPGSRSVLRGGCNYIETLLRAEGGRKISIALIFYTDCFRFQMTFARYIRHQKLNDIKNSCKYGHRWRGRGGGGALVRGAAMATARTAPHATISLWRRRGQFRFRSNRITDCGSTVAGTGAPPPAPDISHLRCSARYQL